MAPELLGCCQDHRQSPLLAIIKSVPEVRALCSAGITRPHSSYGPVRRPRGPSPKVTSRARPSSPPGLPRLPVSLFQRAVPTTPADQDGCTCRLLPPPARPSPYLRRVGIRDFTFEACSGFTRITARWIAQPPKAAFVTGLRSIRLPGQRELYTKVPKIEIRPICQPSGSCTTLTCWNAANIRISLAKLMPLRGCLPGALCGMCNPLPFK